MKVEDRIEQEQACEMISLTGMELVNCYKGCGWTVAGFRDGELEKLHYVLNFGSNLEDNVHQQAKKAYKVALKKAKAFKDGGLEIWAGLSTCGELCEPFPLDMSNAKSLAALARRIGDDINI